MTSHEPLHPSRPPRQSSVRRTVAALVAFASMPLILSATADLAGAPAQVATAAKPTLVLSAAQSRGNDQASAVVTDLFSGEDRAELWPSEQSVLDVLQRLAPEMVPEVQGALADPTTRDGMFARLRKEAQRLYGLAILRDRNEKLYEAKIGVILAQQDTYRAWCDYYEAKESGRLEDLDRARKRLASAAKVAADRDLFVQGLELLALEDYIDQRRRELAHKSTNLDSDVARVVEGFINSAPPCARQPVARLLGTERPTAAPPVGERPLDRRSGE